MLTDVQVDRYCRQVILGEVGGRGQDRLLGATVNLYGRGDAALLCVSYLAGAGVGEIALGDAPLDGAAAAALGMCGGGLEEIERLIARRNPDCRLLPHAVEQPSAAVVIGAPLPTRLPSGAVVVWGGGSAERLLCVQLSAGRACRDCLAALVGAEPVDEPSALLGTLLALMTLRALLGIEPIERASVWRVDWQRPEARPAAFPSRPGCSLCST